MISSLLSKHRNFCLLNIETSGNKGHDTVPHAATGWISQVPNDARESFDRHDARESFDRAQILCQTPRRSLVALCLHSPLSHIRQTIWTCGGWSLSRHNKCMASLWMYLLRHHRHSSVTISKDLIIFIQLLHLDTSAI